MMRALRHPALGLALIVLAVGKLPQQLSMLGNFLRDDYDLPVALTLPIVVRIVALLAQAGTGWAIAWRRRPAVWFAVWLAASAGLAVAAAVAARGADDFSLGAVVGAGIEAVGLPVLVAVASLRYRDELEEDRTSGDVVALLLVFALQAVMWLGILLVQNIAILARIHGTPRDLVMMMLWPAISLGVGVVALVAARRIARDPASRALFVYTVVAVALHAGMFALSVGSALFEEPGYAHFIIITQVASLPTLAVPIALWMYGRAPLPRGPPSRVPLWIAVSYVPVLAIRVLVSGDLNVLVGTGRTALFVAIGATLGGVLLAAFDLAIRRRASARWWLAGAALAVGLLLAAAAYDVQQTQASMIPVVAPIAELFVATSVAAWLHRR